MNTHDGKDAAPYLRADLVIGNTWMLPDWSTGPRGDELLPPFIHYARTFPDEHGQPREESDRWEQARVLTRIARECFEEAHEP